MSQISQFQIYKHEAFENVIIEYKVYIELSAVKGDFLLPCHKAETSSEFKQKLLEMIYQCLLEILFIKMRVSRQIKKLKNIRITDYLFILRSRLGCLYFRFNSFLVTA